jgi:hypothetical protein
MNKSVCCGESIIENTAKSLIHGKDVAIVILHLYFHLFQRICVVWLAELKLEQEHRVNVEIFMKVVDVSYMADYLLAHALKEVKQGLLSMVWPPKRSEAHERLINVYFFTRDLCSSLLMRYEPDL